MFWRGPVLLAVAFALAGCVSVGPDYVEPELVVPDAWHMRIVQQVEQGPQATLQTWWTVFDDPVLDQLIERARRHINTRVETVG